MVTHLLSSVCYTICTSQIALISWRPHMHISAFVDELNWPNALSHFRWSEENRYIGRLRTTLNRTRAVWNVKQTQVQCGAGVRLVLFWDSVDQFRYVQATPTFQLSTLLHHQNRLVICNQWLPTNCSPLMNTNKNCSEKCNLLHYTF